MQYELIQRPGKPALYPVEPLLEFLEGRGITEYKEMSEACGKSPEWISRLLKRKEANPETGLTDEVADVVAINLGVHPIFVWGEMYLEWMKPRSGSPA